MSTQSSSSPRPRGAPPGNRNHLKHGFYSRQFRKIDLRDLEKHQFNGLIDETNLIRIYMRRVIEKAADDETCDPLAVLRLLCLGSITLTRLLKVQKQIFDPRSEADNLLEQALAKVAEEWPTF